MNHEQKTVAIVAEVANIFDQVAVGPLHTPALYSCFLRALVNARSDAAPAAQDQQQQQQQQPDGNTAQPVDPLAAPSFAHPQLRSLGLENFSYSGEMGPVADISTFPPTMAPNPEGMDMSMLSMDSILSSEFWDSVLVPGKLCGPFALLHEHRADRRMY